MYVDVRVEKNEFNMEKGEICTSSAVLLVVKPTHEYELDYIRNSNFSIFEGRKINIHLFLNVTRYAGYSYQYMVKQIFFMH